MIKLKIDSSINKELLFSLCSGTLWLVGLVLLSAPYDYILFLISAFLGGIYPLRYAINDLLKAKINSLRGHCHLNE